LFFLPLFSFREVSFATAPKANRETRIWGKKNRIMDNMVWKLEDFPLETEVTLYDIRVAKKPGREPFLALEGKHVLPYLSMFDSLTWLYALKIMELSIWY
jgi:hypothetical protein